MPRQKRKARCGASNVQSEEIVDCNDQAENSAVANVNRNGCRGARGP